MGHKNYSSFIALMAFSLAWVCILVLANNLLFKSNNLFWLLTMPFEYSFAFQLVIEAGVGVAVFVRFFVNKRGMEAEIIDRLGNGFSRPPFAAVVVSLFICFVLNLAYDKWLLLSIF